MNVECEKNTFKAQFYENKNRSVSSAVLYIDSVADRYFLINSSSLAIISSFSFSILSYKAIFSS
ncbi:Uncharacterised protein [Elizabethkingia anophelis]|uniref:Uncharacterized protein n=1 Tax=Elizabethkingia anophelis TaxID=1117645 RepID=A0A7Z7LX12_9FLAO|nr:Uncharacterised protein [Elizabethkingia anophelis]